jgi:hypothetical protein
MQNLEQTSSADAPITERVLLATIEQQHGYDMLAAYDGDEVTRFTGPLDVVRWTELKMLLHAIKSGVVRANLVSANEIHAVPNFSLGEAGWSPAMDIRANVSLPSTIRIHKAKTVVELILVGLKRDAANDAPDLHTDMLNSEEIAAVQEVIGETLAASGGKRLSVPLTIGVFGTVFELKGKLGVKPSLANFQAVPEQFCGQFVGFDGETRELFFRTRDKRVVMNFEPTLVDLREIVRACLEKKECLVRTHKTIARNGAEVHAYIPDKPFKTAPF